MNVAVGSGLSRLGSAHPLPGGCTAVSLTRPHLLLEPAQLVLRARLIEVADAAFGSPTASVWERRLASGFLDRLRALHLVLGPDGELVGWSGHRARTFGLDRVVYFDSTGLLPEWQGRGRIPALQRAVLASERAAEPRARPVLALRTRNPRAYRLALRLGGAPAAVAPTLEGTVPPSWRALFAAVAAWLGPELIDPSTGHIPEAYADRPWLYGAQTETSSGDPAIDALFDRLGPTGALLVLARPTT